MLKSALAYAQKFGWNIFPLVSGGKKPLLKDWPTRATTDPTTIRKWWGQWPNANIGLALGKSHLLAVDIDEREEYSGMESWRDIIIEHDITSDTLTQITPSGGQHLLYLCADESIRNSAGKLGEGVDIRANGGYIVLAPSSNKNGGSWTWDVDLHPAEKAPEPLPIALRRLIVSRKRNRTIEPPEDPAIYAGQRNTVLASLAGTMRARGMTPTSIGAALESENELRCKPPLPQYEIDQIVKSATSWEPGTLGYERTFALTDIGNRDRMVATYGKHIRYCKAMGHWLTWDGRVWTTDAKQGIIETAINTARNIRQEVDNADDPDIGKSISKWAHTSQSNTKLKAMVELAKSEPAVAIVPEQLDQHDWLLNTKNCILDLKTGQQLEHDPQYLMTRLADAHYDPEATAPQWQCFLEEIFENDQELITFVQRALGYSLTASTREQVMFIPYGTGANGKSTLLEVVSRIMDDYMDRTPSETLLIRKLGTISNDIAQLAGVRLVAAAETDDGARLAEALIKQMTGGEAIKARFLYAEHFSFYPRFKIWLATNHKPEIRGTDHAIWRRVLMVPFNVTIPDSEQDKDLTEKLMGEAPGILNWLVQGCLNWQEQGLNPPTQVIGLTQQYKLEMDVLAAFLRDACVEEDNLTTTIADLYDTYCSWAKQSGEDPMTKIKFGRKVRERGFKNGTTGQTRIWLGIGIKGKHNQTALL